MSEKLSSLILPIKNEQTGQNENKEFKIMVKETNKEPYVSRTARDGLVKIPQLVGGTVAWNQMIRNGNFADGISNWDRFRGAIAVSNNILTYTVLDVGSFIGANRLTQDISFNSSHKYIVRADIKASKNYDFAYRFVVNNGADRIVANHFSLTTSWQTCILTTTTTTLLSSDVGHSIWLSPYSDNMAVGDTIDFRNIQLFDLTQMFGTAIADYVYSLEQATEGSGIAWLQSYGFFTKDYYAYDAGSLQSVCTSARKITALDGTVRTYPIDNVELRGLFKLDANNKLYADGDIYPPSGSGTRKYGIVDLGTLDYTYVRGANSRMATTIQNAKDIDNNTVANLITPKYLADTKNNIYAHSKDKTIGIGPNGSCWIYDTSYTDAATFKTAMAGQYLVYELATETTFSADSYINPQRSEGTEEFVDGLTRDVMIPVGNESTYYLSEVLPIAVEYTDGVAEDVERDITNTQSLIAPILMSLVAPTDGLSAGEQFVYNGLLYKVTVAIASGGTIIIDGNCKLADNVTNQILLLTSELNKLKNATRRTQRNITTDLANLPTAVAEQNLEKYGYSIGDYFIGNSGYTYFLADPNTFRGAQSNYAVIDQNHISIVVKTGANSKWNESNDTSTGYSGSVLHSYLSDTVLNNIKSDMIALFGGSTGLEHLLSHKLLWTTAMSVCDWSEDVQYISALTEPQVYGATIWSIDSYQTGEAWKQLELFKKFSYMEVLDWKWFWLRSIRSASYACFATVSGCANHAGASASAGVVGLIIFK